MESSTEFRPAERTHRSLLAGAEKRLLLWLAARMPSWINSDHLTALGFISLFGAGASYWDARSNRAGLIAATIFFILNWFGDSLAEPWPASATGSVPATASTSTTSSTPAAASASSPGWRSPAT